MGKKQRRQPIKQVAKRSDVIFARRWKPLLFLITISGIAVLAGVGGFIAAKSSPKPVQATGQTVDSLDTLLTMSPEQLSGVDIALVNLLCAKGLPGAEKLAFLMLWPRWINELSGLPTKPIVTSIA